MQCNVSQFNFTYSKHLPIKSLNNASLQRSACTNDFELGLRLRPFELVMQRGLHLESKNNLFLVALFIKSSRGTPITSIIQASCSTSFSPGNSGDPVYSSANMQPVMEKTNYLSQQLH